MDSLALPCDNCDGDGYTSDGDDDEPCELCNGTGCVIVCPHCLEYQPADEHAIIPCRDCRQVEDAFDD